MLFRYDCTAVSDLCPNVRDTTVRDTTVRGPNVRDTTVPQRARHSCGALQAHSCGAHLAY